jgi:hypothetical protein
MRNLVLCMNNQIYIQSIWKCINEKGNYIWMNIDTFLSKLTFREEWTLLLRMEVRALIICEVAIWPMSTLYFLFILVFPSLFLFMCHSSSLSMSDVVFMCR